MTIRSTLYKSIICRPLSGGKRIFLILDNLDGRCAESVDYMHRKRAPYEHYVAELRERHPGLQVIDAFTPFCLGGRCSILRDGRLLLRDRHHLTHYGAGIAFSHLDDVIDLLAPLPLAAVR